MESIFRSIQQAFSRKKKVKKISLGICAMDKKATSKPMRELLKRLPEELFDIVIFGDDCILNAPVDKWPVVEALIAFYSTNFPTEKALQYVSLRKPWMVNDLEMEKVLKDRRLVYKLLQDQEISVPKHVILSRDDPNIENVVEEYDEYVVINGIQMNKPLVEKPVDAEDHNIYIYYPMSAGGGSKRLFRKVDDRSSEFYPRENELRKSGSYIYEEFLTTQGTDVKVYTVGPDYAHAEARKSPVVDGKVNRDIQGLEVRYPVILNQNEKDIARKIVTSFRQTVCGFDILRVSGNSYICDVNGFSFVKNSRKYYDDASQILIEIFVSQIRPELFSIPSTRLPLLRNSNDLLLGRSRSSSAVTNTPTNTSGSGTGNANDFETSSVTTVEDQARSQTPDEFSRSPQIPAIKEDEEELRCLIAIIRHGDRTPKQKMKLKITIPKYLDYFHSYASSPMKDLKVKSKSALVKFLEVTRSIIEDQSIPRSDPVFAKLRQMKDVLERWEISGINRKLQMKPQKWSDDTEECGPRATEVLLILKWGGDLTPLGIEQAELVGTQFRHDMYPDQQGGGVLRLHSTYRHDLKIKASDEGRVMKTAAAFTKGLLELEGQLTPILVSLVTVEEKNRQMLDRGGNLTVKDDMDHCKEHLNLLQIDEELTDEKINFIAPNCPSSVFEAMKAIGNPWKSLSRIHELIGELVDHLRVLSSESAGDLGISTPVLQRDLLTSASSSSFGGLSLSDSPHPGSLSPSSAISAGDIEAMMPRLASLLKPTTAAVATNDGMLSNECPPLSTDMLNVSNDNNSVDGDMDQASTLDPIILSREVSASEEELVRGSVASSTASTVPRTSSLTIKNYPPSSDSMTGLNSTSKNRISSSASVASVDSFPSQLESDGLYLSETYALMRDRWEKLYKDFFNATSNMFDLTKVPDVYDMIRYDCLHNSQLNLSAMDDLYRLSSSFENAVVPQEYGSDAVEKRVIGSKMCGALLEKIKYDLSISQADIRVDNGFMLDHSHAADLAINSLGRHVRTRLYFTSESHICTLLNVLRYSLPGRPQAFSEEGIQALDQIKELSYLTQVVIRLFEDRDDPMKFRCEIQLSPGANGCPWTSKKNEIAPFVTLNKAISYEDMIICLEDAIAASHDGSTGTFDGSTSSSLLSSSSLSSSSCHANMNGGHGGFMAYSNEVDESGQPLASKDHGGSIGGSEDCYPPSIKLESMSPTSSRLRDTTVITNSRLDTSDRWEFNLFPTFAKKDKKKKKSKKIEKEEDSEKNSEKDKEKSCKDNEEGKMNVKKIQEQDAEAAESP